MMEIAYVTDGRMYECIFVYVLCVCIHVVHSHNIFMGGNAHILVVFLKEDVVGMCRMCALLMVVKTICLQGVCHSS